MDHNDNELGGTTLMAICVPSPTKREGEKRKKENQKKRKMGWGGGLL
jgi:hypothetical protein